MQEKTREKLLGNRFFWVMCGVLPLVIFAAVMLGLFTRQQEMSIQRLLQETARSAAHVVDTTVREQVGLLKGMAALQSLDNNDFETFRLDLQRVWKMHPEWRTIILTDESKPVFNLRCPPGTPLVPLRDPDSLKKVWENRKPYVGNLSYGFVAIRIPVFRENRIVYSLVAPTDPSFFQSALYARYAQQHPGHWRFIVVGDDNVVITASKDVAVKTGDRVALSILEKNVRSLVSEPMRQSAPVRIRSSGWRIILFAPSNVVEAPFVRRRIIAALAGIVAVLMTTILIFVLSASWAARQETIRLRKEIEQRKRIQRALADNEKRFRSLVENAPDAIFVKTDGCFAYLNDAAVSLFGVGQAKALIGKPVMQRFHPDCRDEIHEQVRRLFQTGRRAPLLSGKVLRLDGTALDVEASAVPFELIGKQGALFFIRDVTAVNKNREQRKKLERQLHQAQKMEAIGRLAGGVAHDFNNLLSIILGYGEMVLDELDAKDPYRPSLEEIHAAALRARDLTRQLLAFSRKQILEMKTVDLNTVVLGFEKLIRRLIGEDITLNLSLMNEELVVKADTSQMEQVLMNLAVNARDAMPNGGRFTLETKIATLDESYTAKKTDIQPGDYAMISVSDTGSGMDTNVLTNIFEPFFTTKDKEKGTGLGLATSYGIIKQHGGDFWVYSEPGKGTTFKIFLPLSGESVSGETLHLEAAKPVSRSATVLVIEDDPSVRMLAVSILQKAGYVVLSSGDVNEAISMAAAHERMIHLVLTDVIMPGMKGPEVYKAIHRISPETKVLYMSGYSDNVVAHHGVLLEGIALIQKPFTVNGLLNKVHQVLDADTAG